MFGIDKHNLGSFGVSRQHDFEKLFSHDNVKINTKGEKMTMYDENTGEIFEFQCITINKDERFETLHIGVKKVGNGLNKEYVALNVFVEDDEGTGNLKPLSQKEVMEGQKEIVEYIRKKYGLNLYCNSVKYTFMEINKTIELKEDVERYGNVLEYITLVAPKKYRRKTKDTDGKNEINLIALQNNSVKIKIYNKTKQLKEYKGIEVEKYYMRIEVCLKDSKKIKSAFGTTEVSEITDNMMLEYYMKTVKVDLFDRLESQIEKSKVELKKELKFQKKEDSKKYPQLFLIGACSLNYKDSKIPLVLDFEQVLDLLKNDVARWDRTYKTLIKEMEKRPYKQGNLDRYAEIKSKIFSN